jgi:hypothetical protein
MKLNKLLFICGFLSVAGYASAQGCYDSSIQSPSPFMGNNGEIFKLDDGTIWEVVAEYEYLYEYLPRVIICPSQGKLSVKGKTLNVIMIGSKNQTTTKDESRKDTPQDYIESQIDGDFNGWEGKTIVKLINGQIWQQRNHYYHYHYAYMPKVIVFQSENGHKMKVEGIDQAVEVTKAN